MQSQRLGVISFWFGLGCCHAEDQTQTYQCARQALCHWAVTLTLFTFDFDSGSHKLPRLALNLWFSCLSLSGSQDFRCAP